MMLWSYNLPFDTKSTTDTQCNNVPCYSLHPKIWTRENNIHTCPFCLEIFQTFDAMMSSGKVCLSAGSPPTWDVPPGEQVSRNACDTRPRQKRAAVRGVHSREAVHFWNVHWNDNTNKRRDRDGYEHLWVSGEICRTGLRHYGWSDKMKLHIFFPVGYERVYIKIQQFLNGAEFIFKACLEMNEFLIHLI